MFFNVSKLVKIRFDKNLNAIESNMHFYTVLYLSVIVSQKFRNKPKYSGKLIF